MNIKNKPLEDAFDKFISSSNLKEIISAFNQLCDVVDLNPAENSSSFYKLLRNKYQGYWKANSLFCKLDKKVSQKEYRNQTACSKLKTLVIGAGPCGLRCAIEFALLGARVVVLEKRDSFSRNNVLHLWPFVIHDLNVLGAKTFFGLFCSGSINHISIRRLQCILLKIALLFGVQVFIGVTFIELMPPSTKDTDKGVVTAEGDIENTFQSNKTIGWRAKILPNDYILSNYEFDAIVGADGKSNVLGFKHKELRCRLAIAITANFINNNTPEEAQVEEISGVAYIFNQQFFKDLSSKTGIDLENIVYYKDETHYYVMTAKKHSLLSKGVLYQDYDDPETLLRSDNINQNALQNYAREAANVATNHKLTNLQYSLNHRGEPDVALFDFTHMFAAENASMVIERQGFSLIKMLVGDSLLEPFWPTGSGCALGFMSALDAAWLVRRIGMINNALSTNKISETQHNVFMLEAIAERESVYQRLSQTNASNMPTNLDAYTVDPRTRYTQCKLNCIGIQQILHLYDTDDQVKILSFETRSSSRQSQFNALPSAKLIGLNTSFNFSLKDSSISQEDSAEGSIMKSEQILRWFQIRLDRYSDSKMFKIDDLNKSWSSGVPFLCLIHLYQPDLVDLASVNSENKCKNLEKAIMIFEKEFKIKPTINIDENWENQDPVKMVFYLEKIYATFQSLIPIRSDENVVPRIRDVRQMKRRPVANITIDSNFANKFHLHSPIVKTLRKSVGSRLKCNDIENGIIRKRREEIIQQYQPKEHPPIKRTHSRGLVSQLTESFVSHKQLSKPHSKNKSLERSSTRLPKNAESLIYSNQLCHFCKKKIILSEQRKFQGIIFHNQCFRCSYCKKELIAGQFRLLDNLDKSARKFYCLPHYELMKLSLSKGRSNKIKDSKIKYDDVDIVFKFKKPKYGLTDFGESVDINKPLLLPVSQLHNNLNAISNDDLEKRVSKALFNLRRVNDESDQDYDGSVDEFYEEGILLDTVEPVDEDKLCWPLGYVKYDLKYAMKRCSVIKRNKLLFKKYLSKDESTSDESDLNYDYNDNGRTSDEEFLDDLAIFGKSQTPIETPRLYNSNKDEIIVQPPIDLSDIIDYNNVPSEVVEKEVSYLLPNIESIEDTPNETAKSIYEDNILAIDTSNIAASETNSSKENSKSLRQLAKLRFCTEPPKPVSINPKEFIGQMNQRKMLIINIPFCFGSAEKLPSMESIFIKVNGNSAVKSLPSKSFEKMILSATIISVNTVSSFEDDNRATIVDRPEPRVTLATEDSEDNSKKWVTKKRHSLSHNIFNEICDIKDIDSLSINTEDSSMTQTDLISENDALKKCVPLAKIKSFHKATLDSELDASLGISSFADAAFVFKSSSNDSINSLENCSSQPSSNKSDRSDVLASNEDDVKNELIGTKLDLNKNSEEFLISETNISKSLHFVESSDSKRSKSKRFKQIFALKQSRTKKKGLGKEEQSSIQICPVIDEASLLGGAKQDIEERHYETVTPPHDILLDDNTVKCLEMMSHCQFAAGDSPLLINSLENTSKQRVCDIHKQLEDIEDRLRMLEGKEGGLPKNASLT